MPIDVKTHLERLKMERMVALLPVREMLAAVMPASCCKITAMVEYDDGAMVYIICERKPEAQ